MTEERKDDPIVAALVSQANTHAKAWGLAMESAEFARGAQIAIDGIKSNSAAVAPAGHGDFRARQYTIRVFLNGLRDLANVRLITSRTDWIERPKVIEEVWRLANDARERLSDRSGLSAKFIAYCNAHLVSIFAVIEERFGHGLYASWEMECETVTCSICTSDIRGCDHISGRWYDDKQCVYKSAGGLVTAVALTETPKDLRCRLWPWKMTEDPTGEMHRFADMPIYIIFSLEGDDDGGSVVEVDGLFRLEDDSDPSDPEPQSD